MANQNKSKLLVRILACILCVMMVISLAYTAIYLLIANAREKEKEENKSTQIEYVLPDKI